jgi:hypothetical protein
MGGEEGKGGARTPLGVCSPCQPFKLPFNSPLPRSWASGGGGGVRKRRSLGGNEKGITRQGEGLGGGRGEGTTTPTRCPIRPLARATHSTLQAIQDNHRQCEQMNPQATSTSHPTPPSLPQARAVQSALKALQDNDRPCQQSNAPRSRWRRGGRRQSGGERAADAGQVSVSVLLPSSQPGSGPELPHSSHPPPTPTSHTLPTLEAQPLPTPQFQAPPTPKSHSLPIPESHPPPTPELLPPSHPTVAGWLSRLRREVGPNSPTWSCAHAALARMAQPIPVGGTAGRKRRRRTGSASAGAAGGGAGPEEGGRNLASGVDAQAAGRSGDTGAAPTAGGASVDAVSGSASGDAILESASGDAILGSDALLLIATEYAMLHLGRRKWRAKRWGLPTEGGAGAAGTAGGGNATGDGGGDAARMPASVLRNSMAAQRSETSLEGGIGDGCSGGSCSSADGCGSDADSDTSEAGVGGSEGSPSCDEACVVASKRRAGAVQQNVQAFPPAHAMEEEEEEEEEYETEKGRGKVGPAGHASSQTCVGETDFHQCGKVAPCVREDVADCARGGGSASAPPGAVSLHVSIRPSCAAAPILSTRLRRPVPSAPGSSPPGGICHLEGADLGSRLLPWQGFLQLQHTPQPVLNGAHPSPPVFGAAHPPSAVANDVRSPPPVFNGVSPTCSSAAAATASCSVHTHLLAVPPTAGLSGASALRAVGRWGESLVYSYLLATLPPTRRVEWLNLEGETRAPFDLKVTDRRVGGAGAGGVGGGGDGGGGGGGAGELSCGESHRAPTGRGGGGESGFWAGGVGPSAGRHGTVFIEVKTTRYYDNNVFELSWGEWE